MFMNCKKSSPINGHVELKWGRTTTACNTTVLRHCLTLIPSALLTGTTLPLQGVGGTQWHVTTCNTKNCGSITHIQQHLTTNCTTSGMRALRPFGGCSRFAGPRGNNNRASVVVVEPGGTNRNETKNTGPMGVCGRANTSAMHSQCIAQPHIPNVQWGHWGHHPRVRKARVGCNHKIPSTTIIGCGGEHRKQANNMVLVRAGNICTLRERPLSGRLNNWVNFT